MVLFNLFLDGCTRNIQSARSILYWIPSIPVALIINSRFAVCVEDPTMLNKQLITYYWCSIKWWGMPSKVSHYLIIVQWQQASLDLKLSSFEVWTPISF